MAAKVVALAVLIPLLAWKWGFAGAVSAVAIAEVFRYAASVVGVGRLGVGLRVLWSDLSLTAAVAVTAGAGCLAGSLFTEDVARLLVSGSVTVVLWMPVLWWAYRSRRW